MLRLWLFEKLHTTELDQQRRAVLHDVPLMCTDKLYLHPVTEARLVSNCIRSDSRRSKPLVPPSRHRPHGFSISHLAILILYILYMYGNKVYLTFNINITMEVMLCLVLFHRITAMQGVVSRKYLVHSRVWEGLRLNI